MDNHKYREEILQAQTQEFGSIIRHSATINKDLLYVVKKYSFEGKEYFIRMARNLDAISDDIIQLGTQVGVILAIFFFFSLLSAYKISGGIQEETNKIMQFLYDLTKKKKNSYINSDYSIEFYQITKHLTKVSKILTKQDKQKAKYTTKLKNANSQKDDISLKKFEI